MRIFTSIKFVLVSCFMMTVIFSSETTTQLTFLSSKAWAEENTRPLPRFVSLRSDTVNVRRGAGKSYELAWIFDQVGLPVEIIQEFDNWRKIRDSEGETGWILSTLLSSRRTALVMPWNALTRTGIYAKADDQSDVRAWLKSNVLVHIDECDGKWCLISGNYKPDKTMDKEEKFSGWIEQNKLWGVYENESVN